MPQHDIFWLSIALFMLGFAVKYKLEHRSMSSGTSFHVIWNIVPCHLEHRSMSSGTLFHIIWNTLPHHLEQCNMLVKPNQKMLELHVKG